uniref:Uncharacterized protein n=1 Tax=Candidatus Methanogaster sp. ANME-2c ERB4 TaxID=2759911 RepID=A0A7G9YP23_9EURY|nr:hypothetical protein BFOKDAJI_00060 [Methanosarcinales archaeon ANME-2c ERB4]
MTMYGLFSKHRMADIYLQVKYAHVGQALLLFGSSRQTQMVISSGTRYSKDVKHTQFNRYQMVDV